MTLEVADRRILVLAHEPAVAGDILGVLTTRLVFGRRGFSVPRHASMGGGVAAPGTAAAAFGRASAAIGLARLRLLKIRLGGQAGIVVLDHVHDLARRLVLDLPGHCLVRPSGGPTPTAFVDFSL